jgi:hypothetical protein
MTGDDHLDRLVRDADPYRSVHLGGAQEQLLEEIMSVPSLTNVPAGPTDGEDSEDRAGRGRWVRRAGIGVAAAAVAGVISVSFLQAARPVEPQSLPQVTQTAVATGSAKWRAMVLKAAEDNPRYLMGEPGWVATSVYGFTDSTGSIRFTKGSQQLDMTWYEAQYYGGYYDDRLEVSKPDPVKVQGWAGNVFTYSASDFEVMLLPRDGSFVGMRTSGTWTRAGFDTVLGRLKRVDGKTWLAALPDDIVKPGQVVERANAILTDVPLPPGFDIATVDLGGASDPYQFGAQVTGKVGCGWIAEWQRAKQAGDKGAEQRAVRALVGSHHWKILNDMNAEGDYPEVFWEYADKVAAGKFPTGYAQGLGCSW